jgi:hypothetical protein
MDDHFIYLRSGASASLYEDNYQYNFCNQFQGRFGVHRGAKIGLAEIHLTFATTAPLRAFLVCDLVDDSLVGDTRANLLRYLDLTADNAFSDPRQVNRVFDRPQFYPIVKFQPNSARIALIDVDSGEPLLKPATPLPETFVVLQFRS